MARVHRLQDRVKVKIKDDEGDEIILSISPLTQHQKNDIQTLFLESATQKNMVKANTAVVLSLKYAIKSISGLEDSDGNPYKLDFEGDVLTDECVDDLLNTAFSGKIALICGGLVNGIPKEFVNKNNEKILNVEILGKADEKK